MTHKSGKVAERVAHLAGCGVDPRYAGYFECFNAGEFYEAHDVLEDLWLECRGGPNDAFYKALIQLAGAFVHLRKERLWPSAKLFRLSRGYLARYPRRFESLDLGRIDKLIEQWLRLLEESDFAENPLLSHAAPEIRLDFGVTSPGKNAADNE